MDSRGTRSPGTSLGRTLVLAVLGLGCAFDTTGAGGATSAGDDDGEPGTGGTTTASTVSSGVSASGGNSTETTGEGSATTNPTDPTAPDTTTSSTTAPEVTTTGETGETEGDTETIEPVTEFGPFGDAEVVPGLRPGGAISFDDDPTLRGDMLEIYFATFRENEGNEDIYRSTRASLDEDWETPTPVELFNSESGETTPMLTRDSLAITYSSDVGGSYDLYLSQRQSEDAEWSPGVRLASLATPENDVAGALSDDLLSILYCSYSTGAGDIYRANRADAASAFTNPAIVIELATVETECGAWFDEGGGLIVFGADRGSNWDIFWAQATDDTISKVERVEGLNTPDYEADPWVSRDFQTVYFSRFIDGTSTIVFAEALPG